MAKRGRVQRFSLKKIVKIEKEKKLKKDFFNKRIGSAILESPDEKIVVAIFNPKDVENSKSYLKGIFYRAKWYYFENGAVTELSKTKYSMVVKDSDFFL